MAELKTAIRHESGRTDEVLTNLLTDYSRLQIRLWLKNKVVSVNGQSVKADYKVRQGDEITALIPGPEALDMVPENIPLTIVYEDEDVAVINGPQEMVVRPSAGHAHGTMVNALMYHTRDLSTINGAIRPGIVYQIDKNTPGPLTVAKNDQAHESLAQRLEDRTSLRKYVVLVHGKIPYGKGIIDAPIGRSEEDREMQAIGEDGESAVTHFAVLERFGGSTLVELELETGRTHQTRVHMGYIGYSLAGDPVYGPKETLKGNGQFLHVQMLGFTHPTTNEKTVFEVPLLEVFEKTLERLRRNIAL